MLFRTACKSGVPFGTSPAARSFRAKNSIELFDCKLRDWIVLVYHEHKAIRPTGNVERPGDGDDVKRIALEQTLVGKRLLPPNLSVDSDISDAGQEPRDCRRGSFQVIVEFYSGMILGESLGPVLAQVSIGKIITSPELNRSGYVLFRFIVRQVLEIRLLGIEPLFAPARDGGRSRFLNRKRISRPFWGFCFLRTCI